jgi:hypothetical protein
MAKFVTGLPFTDREIGREKLTLEKAFARGDAKTAKLRRRKGYHQSYQSRATLHTNMAGRRMQGDRD